MTTSSFSSLVGAVMSGSPESAPEGANGSEVSPHYPDRRVPRPDVPALQDVGALSGVSRPTEMTMTPPTPFELRQALRKAIKTIGVFHDMLGEGKVIRPVTLVAFLNEVRQILVQAEAHFARPERELEP